MINMWNFPLTCFIPIFLFILIKQHIHLHTAHIGKQIYTWYDHFPIDSIFVSPVIFLNIYSDAC